MKKAKIITEWNNPLISPEIEEDYYLFTHKEVEMINNGEIIFHNGFLYRSGDVPLKVKTIEMGVHLFPLNIYGETKQHPKLEGLTIGTREWTPRETRPQF